MDNFARNIYLTGVGMAIASLVEQTQDMLNESGIEEESLQEFARYLEEFDTIGFATHPTEYRQLLNNGGLEKARKRVELVRALFKLAQEA